MRTMPLDNIKIQSLYHKGLTAKAIAMELGSSPRTICRHLKSLSCHLKRGGNRKKIPIDLDLLRQLYIDKRLTIRETAERLGKSKSTVHRGIRELGCSRGHAPKIRDHNYIRIRQPDHPRADSSGRIPEHLLVWEEHHRCSLPKGWQIHHLNGIPDDNRPSNLVALSPAKHRGAHTRLLDEKSKRIRELEIENCQLRRALEDSQMIFYIGEN